MIEGFEAAADGWAEAYVLANTPGYLYRKLRTDLGVERLASLRSSEQLVQLIEAIDESQHRDACAAATAYAATVALTKQGAHAAIDSMLTRDFAALEWIQPILRLWHATWRPTTQTSLIVTKPKISKEIEAPSTTRRTAVTQTRDVKLS